MNQDSGAVAGKGPSHRGVEIGVAVATAVFGLITILGSLQVGINWGAEGPRAGFFPFWVGIVIVSGSAINLALALREHVTGKLFAEWGQLREVLRVVIPTTIYVATIPYLGIYVASLVLIAVFMKWLGRYGWLLTLAVSFGVVVLTYLLFERWFLIPLPKGPLEDWLYL